MKKLYILGIAAILSSTFISCEKCATCTINQDGQMLTDDVCNKGRTYDNHIDHMEDSGWSCSED
ncbi:MAG: hypothetical protein CL843_02215 [Crocinitomicaceae bacterium]|nr:hypothetical protein [Crocinitomicaceae bacterium]|tara:strand:- start:258 stop:449 length:192 start_codon:yes stop_codon:yes gene_type:complete